MPVSVAIVTARSLRGMVRDDAEETDAELLVRFIELRDEAAFARLVRRHGPMVWGVCRRIVANDQDAEDAFQATFLVLVKKARTVSPRDTVGSWLHGVARRAALFARRSIARRRERVGDVPERSAADADPLDELRSVLDEELNRLPDIYRAVIILCDLEGRTRREAAILIGRPEGTVAGRLARARDMLTKRMSRYAPSVSVAALLPGTASARTPEVLQTVPGSAATLASELLNAMRRGHVMKTATIAILVFGCAGFGVLLRASPDTGETAESIQPAAEQKAPKTDEKIAWGQEVEGLQAGLTTDARTIHHGEKARFEVKLRNVGKAEITITYGLLHDSPPRLSYANGERVFVTMPPILGPIVIPTEQVIKPGETITLFNPEFAMEPVDVQKRVGPAPMVRTPTIQVGPSKLKVDYGGMVHSHPKLSTGTLEIQVKEKLLPDDAFAWGKEVDGLQAGIAFGDKKSFHAGEQMTPKIRIRNAANATIDYSHFAGLFRYAHPTVRDAKGREINLGEPPHYFYRPVSQTGKLKFGEQIDFGGAVILLNPPEAIPNFHYIKVQSGKYTVSFGGFLNSHPMLATGFTEFDAKASVAPEPKLPEARDSKTLAGTWVAVRATYDGSPTASKTKLTVKFEPDVLILEEGELKTSARYMVAADQTPAPIDIIPASGAEKDKSFKGIVQRDGDVLTLCFREPGGKRPTEFKSEPGGKTTLIEFKRQTK